MEIEMMYNNTASSSVKTVDGKRRALDLVGTINALSQAADKDRLAGT